MTAAVGTTSHEVIAALVDDGTFDQWDLTAESIIYGRAEMGGIPVVLLLSEFDFIGGSVGLEAGRRIINCIERARDLELPLIMSPASGGTRMQDGTRAFVAMAGIVAAMCAFRAAGLPALAYIRDPTMGGALASWVSLAHVLFAEPSARVGLLGPRVVQSITGRPFNAEVQHVKHLKRLGVIDEVLPLLPFRDEAIAILTAWSHRVTPPAPSEPVKQHPVLNAPENRGETVERSRDPNRLTSIKLLERWRVSRELNATLDGGRDESIRFAFARIGRTGAIVMAQDPRHAVKTTALRQAQRAIAIADELGLPLITLIQTEGACLDEEAEEAANAAEHARTLRALLTVQPPSISVLVGQGAGVSALALFPADRVIALEHSWLSPLPLEGAAEILYRDSTRTGAVATALRISAADLASDGIVDAVIRESDHLNEGMLATALEKQCEKALTDLLAIDSATRLAGRAARYQRF